ncbi:glycosyltransferase [Magnetofaba australis]|uniref:Putative glycosyltransferase n=1 Tax=Magnetofaba australis IT-1 TaxID=1434232 RepID=A0A1Y2K2U0_9PROT|nr:glycosyltransferase [Magnetofaba australis]OSM01916.1 putative glycosyltransferase [Magnetofaba australis IT-1]
MRVAVVHDWLAERGGAERVLEQILLLYPQATLYALVDFLPESERDFLGGRRAITSFIQHLPMARRRFRAYLPLMPLAVAQWDFSAFDLVISSSHCVVKSVRTGPRQLHVSYVHTPMRYAWDLQTLYLQRLRWPLGRAPLRALLMALRRWDRRTADRVDYYLANSEFVAGRIHRSYGKRAHVVHPPVYCDQIPHSAQSEGFYLTLSRLVPYKRVDLITAAFARMPDKRLVVIGDGPEWARVAQAANGAPNVTLLGRLDDEQARDYLARCRAFVFAAEEDFGIVPLEAQAAGKPVIAYAGGGVLETLRPASNGAENAEPVAWFFAEQSVEAICQAVAQFETTQLSESSAQRCRENASRFATPLFQARFQEAVERAQARYAPSIRK